MKNRKRFVSIMAGIMAARNALHELKAGRSPQNFSNFFNQGSFFA